MMFSPGPWVVTPTAIEFEKEKDALVGEFDVILPVKSMSFPEIKENARLIAAAPEMYEALKAIKDTLGAIEWGTPEHAEELLGEVIDKFYDSIKGILAKAEGRDGREGE